jgi:mannosyltransferase OCH1-like enzyme
MKIPTIIHQTWKTKEVPGEYFKWVQSWRLFNPGWEYRLWTDDDNRMFMAQEFPEHLHMYDSFPKNIMRVDCIRYFILYKYGGVYADLDFECVANLAPLLQNHSLVIGQEPVEHAKVFGRNRMVCNAWMASEPRHPFWHAVISEIHKRHVQGVDNVMGMTGPVLVDDVYEMYAASRVKDIYLAPIESLYPLLSGAHGKAFKRNGQKVYAVHHWKNSWTKSPPIPPMYEEFYFYPTLDSPDNDLDRGMDLEQSRQKCLKHRRATCFNSDGWVKQSYASLQRVWPSDKGIYIKKFAQGFPTFEGYTLYIGKDCNGFDLYRFCTNDLTVLKEMADRDPWVAAFNTDGCFKYRADMIQTPGNGVRGSYIAIYVKKDRKVPDWLEHWDYYPCVDSIGGDIGQVKPPMIHAYTNLQHMSPLDCFNVQTIQQQLRIYRDNPDVLAINTDGMLKGSLKPMHEWSKYPIYRYIGLFVKRDRSILPRTLTIREEEEEEEEEEVSTMKISSSIEKVEIPVRKIPNILWQTYKSMKQLPTQAIQCIATWKHMNPDYEYRFMDDAQMDQFVQKEMGEPWFTMYKDMPIPVMKADLWRIMVLYVYGGVYTDIDTKCFVPIRQWAHIGDRSFIIGYESDNFHFCNWTIAAAPKHPILKSILDAIRKRWQEGIRTTYEHLVHYHSGPGVVTKGITDFFRVGSTYHARLKDFKVPMEYEEDVVFYDESKFNDVYVRHYEASRNWKQGYGSWKDQMKEYNTHNEQLSMMEQLEGFYETYLERPIDIEGRNHYRNQIFQHGWSIERVREDIMNSEEYKRIQEKKRISVLETCLPFGMDEDKKQVFIDFVKRYNISSQDIEILCQLFTRTTIEEEEKNE